MQYTLVKVVFSQRNYMLKRAVGSWGKNTDCGFKGVLDSLTANTANSAFKAHLAFYLHWRCLWSSSRMHSAHMYIAVLLKDEP